MNGWLHLNGWAWAGMGAGVLFVVLGVWPILAVGRQADKANGCLEEQVEQ